MSGVNEQAKAAQPGRKEGDAGRVDIQHLALFPPCTAVDECLVAVAAATSITAYGRYLMNVQVAEVSSPQLDEHRIRYLLPIYVTATTGKDIQLYRACEQLRYGHPNQLFIKE